MRVHHIAIQVRDLDRARAFYVDALGLVEVRRQPHSIWLDADGALVMLEACANASAMLPGLASAARVNVSGSSTAKAAKDRGRRHVRVAVSRCAQGGKPPWRSEHAGLHLLAFVIGAQEWSAWRAKLAKAGAPIEGETRFTLYTRDPDGTRIGLSSYPASEGSVT